MRTFAAAVAAAYLLVSGHILGEHSTETLKQADWQSRYEEAQMQIDVQAQTICEQAQKIDTLEAANAALDQRLTEVKAKL